MSPTNLPAQPDPISAAPWREVFLRITAGVRVGALPAPFALGRTPVGFGLICATEGDLEQWSRHIAPGESLLGWAVSLETAPTPPSSTSPTHGWPILGPHTIDQRRTAGLL